MAKAAGARIRALPVRDDVGHRRVVVWKPVGRPEAVGDLLSREGERAAGQLLDRRVGGYRGRTGRTGRRGQRDGIRPCWWFAGRSKHSRCNERRDAKNDEDNESAHTEPPWSQRLFRLRNYTPKSGQGV